MFSRNKIFFYLFLTVLLIQMLFQQLFKPLDELVLFLLLVVIFLDVVANGNVKRYKSLMVVEGVFLFYFVFTVLFRDFNTVAAAANDFILQQKAFVPFLIAYAMSPRLEGWMRQVLKAVSVATSAVLVGIYASGMTLTVLGHVYNYGTISVSVSLLYLYCSLNEEGRVSTRDLWIALLLLSVGLLGGRSKYYGELVVALFMLFVYRPGFVKNMNLKYATLIVAGVAMVVIVAWSKIEYYYIIGNSDVYDPDVMMSYARPVLYVTMFLILIDYPIFGSGLASFATHSSSPLVHYSSLYHQYGIDKMWGLSEAYPSFISDAYFPELAQFGLVGVALFIGFWVWIYQKLRLSLHRGRTLEFAIGAISIGFAMIESTSGAAILQAGSFIPMMLLGIIAGQYRTMSKEEKREILNTEYIKS